MRKLADLGDKNRREGIKFVVVLKDRIVVKLTGVGNTAFCRCEFLL